jgi:hypothetical protein
MIETAAHDSYSSIFLSYFSYIFSSQSQTGAPEHKVLGAPEMFFRCAPPSCSLAVIARFPATRAALPWLRLCLAAGTGVEREHETVRCNRNGWFLKFHVEAPSVLQRQAAGNHTRACLDSWPADVSRLTVVFLRIVILRVF